MGTRPPPVSGVSRQCHWAAPGYWTGFAGLHMPWNARLGQQVPSPPRALPAAPGRLWKFWNPGWRDSIGEWPSLSLFVLFQPTSSQAQSHFRTPSRARPSHPAYACNVQGLGDDARSPEWDLHDVCGAIPRLRQSLAVCLSSAWSLPCRQATRATQCPAVRKFQAACREIASEISPPRLGFVPIINLAT